MGFKHNMQGKCHSGYCGLKEKSGSSHQAQEKRSLNSSSAYCPSMEIKVAVQDYLECLKKKKNSLFAFYILLFVGEFSPQNSGILYT